MLGGCRWFQPVYLQSITDSLVVVRLLYQCPNVASDRCLLHGSTTYMILPQGAIRSSRRFRRMGKNHPWPILGLEGLFEVGLSCPSTWTEIWSLNPWRSYFRKFEHFHPHPDYPLVDASVRGSNGPVHVGFFSTATEWSSEFVDSCTAAGIPRTHDFNAPNGLIGASRVRRRCSFHLFAETILNYSLLRLVSLIRDRACGLESHSHPI